MRRSAEARVKSFAGAAPAGVPRPLQTAWQAFCQVKRHLPAAGATGARASTGAATRGSRTAAARGPASASCATGAAATTPACTGSGAAGIIAVAGGDKNCSGSDQGNDESFHGVLLFETKSRSAAALVTVGFGTAGGMARQTRARCAAQEGRHGHDLKIGTAHALMNPNGCDRGAQFCLSDAREAVFLRSEAKNRLSLVT